MKYMHFNSSCAYAGVANLLELKGIDVEDYDIALKMELPYLLGKEEYGFAAGPMLQSSKWFNLYLKTVGFELIEKQVKISDLGTYLMVSGPAMLGMLVRENDKHAVVFLEKQEDKYLFINNKYEDSSEEEKLIINKSQLQDHFDEINIVGTLKPCAKEKADMVPCLYESIENLRELDDKLEDFCSVKQTKNQLSKDIDSLFRPLLLDLPTMMALIKREDFVKELRYLQGSFVNTLFKKDYEELLLKEHLDMQRIHSAVKSWNDLICKRINELKA